MKKVADHTGLDKKLFPEHHLFVEINALGAETRRCDPFIRSTDELHRAQFFQVDQIWKQTLSPASPANGGR